MALVLLAGAGVGHPPPERARQEVEEPMMVLM